MSYFYEEHSFGQENGMDLPDQFISYEISLKNNERHFHELIAPSERPTFSNTQLENENKEIENGEPIIQIDDNRTILDKKNVEEKERMKIIPLSIINFQMIMSEEE